ncbi:hypothetical protein MOQ_001948 [Trypanosoma cruzi marinkellei]|uniref:TLC domain-containing protein n=1 Tax=Trypanosoma cruzi marinkellei TaxID=85056 RepID=K2NJB1_TRYCR|nr:hypothetical protein MOQ_001948 [Trypanosoma cruzi marinkellei]
MTARIHAHNVHNGNYICHNGVGGLSVFQRLLIVSSAFFFFSAFFVSVWSVLRHHYRQFFTMTIEIQCDLTSRVISVFHSLLVVPALLGGVASMKWGNNYEPLGDVSFMQGLLCISLGYFLYDTAVLVLYRQPNWLWFVFHHVVSTIPYFIYMFVGYCPYGLFILVCFMFVEATNMSLYTKATLEENGMSNTKMYSVALYSLFFLWIVFRLINPTLLLIIVHRNIIPSIPAGKRLCLIPSVLCAYVVSFLCYGVFVMLCREMTLHWKRSTVAGDVVYVEAMPVGEVTVSDMKECDFHASELNPTHPSAREEN